MAAVSRASMFGLVAVVLATSAAHEAWQWQRERALGRALAAAARPGDILMLSSDVCVHCAAARQWLTRHRVPHRECSIDRDRECAALHAARGAPGTPLLLVRGEAQLGFDAARVRAALAAGG